MAAPARPPQDPDFNERRNLAGVYPAKAAELARTLAAWHATIPPCPQYVNGAGCEAFSSPSLRPQPDKADDAVPPAGPAAGQLRPHWQDSEADVWFDRERGQHVSF